MSREEIGGTTTPAPEASLAGTFLPSTCPASPVGVPGDAGAFSEGSKPGLARWKTPERAAVVRQMWETHSRADIWDVLRAMDGPTLPATLSSLTKWGTGGLGLTALTHAQGASRAGMKTKAMRQEKARRAAAAAAAAHEVVEVVPPPPPVLVSRNCLHCLRPFDAVGRFMRVCDPCKKTGIFSGAAA